jgi:hypothetical protein
MPLPTNKESFRNLFPDITVGDVQMADLWRAWTITEELKNKIKVFDEYFIEENDRWDLIAEEVYGDRRLWWILVMFNNIEDPFSLYFEKGVTSSIKKIKIIKESDVAIILKAVRDKRLKFEV